MNASPTTTAIARAARSLKAPSLTAAMLPASEKWQASESTGGVIDLREAHVLSQLRIRYLAAALLAILVLAGSASAQSGGDTRVANGSPAGPFAQNKQNEPAVAIDAAHPNIVAAGSNDEIDMEACNAGPDDDCPFTPDVGSSGIYFSTNSAATWHQPTYTGLTARHCLGSPGDSDPECVPRRGPIGTLPNYDTAGLLSDGDPALAFGPVYRNGHFAWSNGSRLYYANLTALREGSTTFKGTEAIAVSHTDDVAAANARSNSAWRRPAIAGKQDGGGSPDREQLWPHNAAGIRFFGSVYVCYAAFNGNGNGFTS